MIGVRLNFNALGTEHTDVPEEDRAPSAWTLPPGAVAPAPWTRVLVRNNMFAGREQAEPEWVQMLAFGRLGLFHTSSEREPRTAGGGQYQAFIRYCRSGQTVCHAEPWADAWGNHGVEQDPRWCGPEQFNYWRVLVDLNCGVSFIALYAGYHASPSVSPGAWARVLPPGGQARFELDAAFARSIANRPATLRVTYLDSGAGAFTVGPSGQRFTTPIGNTGRWQVAEYALKKASGTEITLSAAAELTLHMVEVRR